MGLVTLSARERKRLELLSRVKEETLSLVDAARLAGLGYRQMKRVWRRYLKDGDGALAHRSRGRRSNRGKAESFREEVLARYQAQYPDFGPSLACEYLEQEGWELDHETLRRWLLDKGLWQPRRRRQRHRQWRERRACRGELVQMDGSHHDWFEGRRAPAVLMVMIDDATNRTYARFYEAEDTPAAMDCFGRYARRYGLPQALYTDRDSIYRCTREARLDEELQGDGPQTQFARAMRTLVVELIAANSPQAKGRVERRNGLFQDRLVKALRLAAISSLEDANRHLDRIFLPMLNRRFTVAARSPEDLHRPLPRGRLLKDILCWEEPRVVQNDWTVRWRHRYFQIAAEHEGLNLSGRTVVVRERLDGSTALIYRDCSLKFRERTAPPAKVATPPPTKARVPSVPAPDHPWRRPAVIRRPSSRPPPTSYMAHSRGAETRAALAVAANGPGE